MEKKPWTQPTLVEHGRVANATAGGCYQIILDGYGGCQYTVDPIQRAKRN